MQWSITGTLFEPDGKAASGQVEIQTFELARSQWRTVAKARLDAKGDFAINLNLGDGPQLPAVRLCETVKARETPRVLAEGALVQVEPGKRIHLAFGDIERLGDEAIARRERSAPFSAADDYLLAGTPRAVAQLAVNMAALRVSPQLAVRAQPASTQLKTQAALSKQLEAQSVELNQKVLLINNLEREKQSHANELKQAQLKISTLEKQLKDKPAAGNEQIELATQQIRLNLSEQILRQATEFELKESDLQRTLNLRNLEIAQFSERIRDLTKASREAAEEAARAREESEDLKAQLDTQVDADQLYGNIARQLQQAQSQLSKDGVPYRLGRVSLNLKTLVTGNSLTLPTLSDLKSKGSSGLFTDVSLEYLPDGDEPADDAPSGITVPDFSDLTETLARRLARDLGLELEAAYQSIGDSGQPVGQAIRQVPAKGTEVTLGERVLVVFTQP
ncbi:MAG: hypothetical protein CMK74_18005 [Pseudomonadales bacterium]|nr:hypothetical protein [Pseudomonadales bacterium]|tara:strand:+ start:602 stop:1948 length:1347 start_codon:yes stop_codon:yes gene_type:complete